MLPRRSSLTGRQYLLIERFSPASGSLWFCKQSAASNSTPLQMTRAQHAGIKNASAPVAFVILYILDLSIFEKSAFPPEKSSPSLGKYTISPGERMNSNAFPFASVAGTGGLFSRIFSRTTRKGIVSNTRSPSARRYTAKYRFVPLWASTNFEALFPLEPTWYFSPSLSLNRARQIGLCDFPFGVYFSMS